MNILSVFIFTLLIELSVSKYNRRSAANLKARKLCSSNQSQQQPLNRINTTLRLFNLRKLMSNSMLEAVLVTPHDENQSPYVSESDKRIQYISGFSGSAGNILITGSKALLWTDGRYHLQADDELDCNWKLMREGIANIPSMSEWLSTEFPNGSRIGGDSKLVPAKVWNELEDDLKNLNRKFSLVDTPTNLIDIIWTDRPSEVLNEAYVLSDFFTGKPWIRKVIEVGKQIKSQEADAMVITACDEISWLLNIRGSDVPYSNYLKAYLILSRTGIVLYTDLKKVENNVSRFFEDNYPGLLKFKNYSDIWLDIADHVKDWTRVIIPSELVFSSGASKKIFDMVPDEKRLYIPSPIIPLMAKKNPTEVLGMKRAYIRDAVALCKLFSNLQSRFDKGEPFDEYKAVKEVERLRREQQYFVTESYANIIGYGPNGAIAHYHPTIKTSSKIFNNSTIVVDTGAQYYDGTIDCTRTIHLGKPNDEHREAYTRVLMGSIQLSALVFPDDVNTANIDAIARAPLWQMGYDYLHGTGHGIGAFRNVHESPINVRYQFNQNSQQLEPDQYFSVEPGFYQPGEFGVRLENILHVIEKSPKKKQRGRRFLRFETVTLVPYSLKLIKYSLLSFGHRKWLNKYNSQIRKIIGPKLLKLNAKEANAWMMKNTERIPDKVNYS